MLFMLVVGVLDRLKIVVIGNGVVVWWLLWFVSVR